MSQNVTLLVSTKPQLFPASTVEEQFVFTIAGVDGTVFGAPVSTASTSASFDAVPVGDYVASVVKNGVTVSKPFSVLTTDITLQVPDTLVISLA